MFFGRQCPDLAVLRKILSLPGNLKQTLNDMYRIICLFALAGVLPVSALPIQTLTDPDPEYLIDTRYLPTDPVATTQHSARKRFDPWQSRQEATLSIGMYTAVQGEDGGAQESYRLDYTSFGFNDLGFRVGVLYIPQLRGIERSFGIPIQFAWRSPLRGRERWSENWPDAAASTIENRGNPLPGLLFILLPQRIEFSGGVTPGWIFGKEDVHSARTPAVNNGEWYDEGILRHHPFTLSIDAEMRLTYRIWRFTLSVSPGIHYHVTDNFRTYTSFSDHRSDPGRWYFSLYGGLGFLF